MICLLQSCQARADDQFASAETLSLDEQHGLAQALDTWRNIRELGNIQFGGANLEDILGNDCELDVCRQINRESPFEVLERGQLQSVDVPLRMR